MTDSGSKPLVETACGLDAKHESHGPGDSRESSNPVAQARISVLVEKLLRHALSNDEARALAAEIKRLRGERDRYFNRINDAETERDEANAAVEAAEARLSQAEARTITTEQHSRALALVSRLMDAKPGTLEADMLDLLADLCTAYEAVHCRWDNLPLPSTGAVIATAKQRPIA